MRVHSPEQSVWAKTGTLISIITNKRTAMSSSERKSSLFWHREVMKFLRFFLLRPVAFRSRCERTIGIAAVDDPFRKIMSEVFEDCFPCLQPDKFEVGAGRLGPGMSNVIDPVRTRFDSKILKERRSVPRHRTAHTDQGAAGNARPMLLDSCIAGGQLPRSGHP